MAINMVECGSCGEVVDAANRLCPHCRAQLQRPVAPAAGPAPVSDGSFAERYRSSVYDGIPPVPPLPHRRSSSTMIVGLGVALIVVAAGIAAMFVIRPAEASPTNRLVYAPSPSATPVPT